MFVAPEIVEQLAEQPSTSLLLLGKQALPEVGLTRLQREGKLPRAGSRALGVLPHEELLQCWIPQRYWEPSA